jgi:hypothetical protein
MNDSQNCPICNTPASIMFGSAVNKVDCPRCGQYEQGKQWENVSDIRQRIVLSGWIREQNAVASVPTIAADIIRRMKDVRVPRFRERTRRALAVIVRKSPLAWANPVAYGQIVQDLELQGASYSSSPDDLRMLFKLLEAENLIQDKQNIGFLVTARGLLAAEDMSSAGGPSAQGFVAMSFNPALNDAWTNGFDPGIRSAGFRPFRIDAKDYVGGIADEIMAEIRRSRFVVADYSGQVNGVYFEAGFALGLGVTVIPTCRQDEIDHLHFDIRHLNTLLWQTPQELALKLQNRIRGVIGNGPGLVQEAR